VAEKGIGRAWKGWAGGWLSAGLVTVSIGWPSSPPGRGQPRRRTCWWRPTGAVSAKAAEPATSSQWESGDAWILSGRDTRRFVRARAAATDGRGADARSVGVKRAENLIASLTGGAVARRRGHAAREVSEIHVLTYGDTQPKQVVRNIESALMAHARPEDRPPQDQRRPDADVRPIEQLQEEAVRAAPSGASSCFRGSRCGLPSDRSGCWCG